MPSSAAPLVPALYIPADPFRTASRLPSWRALRLGRRARATRTRGGPSDRAVKPPAPRTVWREAQKGVEDERSTGTGGDAQGRVRADVGWQARAVGGQWTPLCGLGDLPSEGLPRRPE